MNQEVEKLNVNSALPAVTDDMMDDILADSGQDNGFKRDDLTIPFLVVLQDLSPQVKKTKDKFIPGAAAGMICNTVTEDLYDGETGVLFVPVYFQRQHTEFETRSNGGGFVADYGDDETVLEDCVRDEATGRLKTPAGNDMVVSMQYYGYVYDDKTGSFKQCVMSLAGTQFKKGRPWNTSIQSLRIPHPKDPNLTINPAMYYMAYRLTTQAESNDQGDWYGWKIRAEVPILQLPGGAAAYREARQFRELIKAGKVKAAHPEPSEPRPPRPEGQAPAANDFDDDIPF